MLVVKNIEVLEVDRSMLRVVYMDEQMVHNAPLCYDTAEETVPITTEMIVGEEFVNARGQKFCIGLSKQVQEAIGLPMKAFSGMSSKIETQRTTISQLKRKYGVVLAKIDKFESMKLWERIKYVFTNKVA